MRINSTLVREPGTKVEPERDRIEVRGRPIPGRSALRYLMLHKPVGFLTTLHDPEGRRTVRELMPPGPRMFPVGRLDADTSGLLLLTNDGELAHRLMHPRYGVMKTYRVVVDGVPDEAMLRRMRHGVELEPGAVSATADVRMLGVREGRAAIEVKIHEGRYRQVRRMCEFVGLDVRHLHRTGYGPLRLAKLPKGASRPLTMNEIRRLRSTSARRGGTSGTEGRVRVPLGRSFRPREEVRTHRARPAPRRERPATSAERARAVDVDHRRGRETPPRGVGQRPARGVGQRPGRGMGQTAARGGFRGAFRKPQRSPAVRSRPPGRGNTGRRTY